MTEDFIKKLMISKQIMDRHNEIPRGQQASTELYENAQVNIPNPEIYNPSPIPASYNIPQEYLEQQKIPSKPMPVTEDRIKNSKLPDAIKDLMIKHPIKQPENYSPSLSEDVIERASRLMKENGQIQTNPTKQKSQPQTQYNNSELKKVIRETLEEILRENGVISESETKTSELFQFRVGKHVFEGKIVKVKKLS